MSVYTFGGLALHKVYDDPKNEAKNVDRHIRQLLSGWKEDANAVQSVAALHRLDSPGAQEEGGKRVYFNLTKTKSLWTYYYGDTICLVGLCRPEPAPQFTEGPPDTEPIVKEMTSWFRSKDPEISPYQYAYIHILEGYDAPSAYALREAAHVDLGGRITFRHLADGQYSVEGPEKSEALQHWTLARAYAVRLAMFLGKVRRYERELKEAPKMVVSSGEDIKWYRQKEENIRVATINFRNEWEEAFKQSMSESDLGVYFDNYLTSTAEVAKDVLRCIDVPKTPASHVPSSVSTPQTEKSGGRALTWPDLVKLAIDRWSSMSWFQRVILVAVFALFAYAVVKWGPGIKASFSGSQTVSVKPAPSR
jgi:hypothetical protein